MNKFLIIIALFSTSFFYGQTYEYSTKIIRAAIQTSEGKKYKILNNYKGPYKLIFEKFSDGNTITLMGPNDKEYLLAPTYHLYKNSGYVELDGFTYQKGLYFLVTSNGEHINIYISTDFNSVLMYNDDDTMWEFK